MKSILRIIVLVAAIFALIAGATWLKFWLDDQSAEKVAHLTAEVENYVAIAKAAPQEPNSGAKPKAKPVLVVMTETGRGPINDGRKMWGIDPLTGELPDNLFPATASEVGSVVALYWGAEKDALYENDAVGYRETCRALVIDKASGDLLAVKSFAGNDPPEKIPEREKRAWGTSCENEVMAFVRQVFASP